MDKRQIYILLTHSGSLLSRCIKTYTQEPYTHVSIALDKNLNELYSFGRLIPNNPLIAGFVKEDIRRGTFALFPNTSYALYSLEIDQTQYNNLIRELFIFKAKHDRYSYNFFGLFGMMFNIPVERKYSYFCSQFIATILYRSGIHIFDKPTGLVSPKDFRESKHLKLIYEGNLSDFDYHISKKRLSI